MSKKLGLTQSRVRSLKEKVLVRFGDDNVTWKEAFIRAIPKASYDEDTHLVKILVPEKDVIIEVRHILEERGLYDERTLNDKLLTVPMESFLEICFALYKEQASAFELPAETALLDIQRRYDNESKSALQRFMEDRSFNGLKALTKEVGKDVLAELLKVLSSSNPALQAGQALLHLASVLLKSQ